MYHAVSTLITISSWLMIAAVSPQSLIAGLMSLIAVSGYWPSSPRPQPLTPGLCPPPAIPPVHPPSPPLCSYSIHPDTSNSGAKSATSRTSQSFPWEELPARQSLHEKVWQKMASAQTPAAGLLVSPACPAAQISSPKHLESGHRALARTAHRWESTPTSCPIPWAN